MKRKLPASLFSLLPLFAGFFAITAKPAPVNLEHYLGRYLTFILLFVTWGVFRWVATTIIGSLKTERKKLIAGYAFLALLSVIIIGAIFLFKNRFERETYEIALLAFGFSALWSRYLLLNRYTLAALWGMLADICVGFLSFQIVVFEWQWQPLVFSIPIAGASVLMNLGVHLHETNSKELLRIIRAILVMMPLSIGVLTFTGSLSSIYLVTSLFLPAETLFHTYRAHSFRLLVILLTLFVAVLAVLATF